MLSFVVCHPLVVVVEADVLGGQHLEASHLRTVLLGKAYEVLPVFCLGVSVVDHHALALR